MAYQTFATYTTLQAQMTNNIKNKHLELGLDALIDEKLRNGGDNFLTSHQASTAYVSKEVFQNLLKRVEALEAVPIYVFSLPFREGFFCCLSRDFRVIV